MSLAADKTLRVGLGGLGAIGLPLARRLAAGLPGLALAALSARDLPRAEARLAISSRCISTTVRRWRRPN